MVKNTGVFVYIDAENARNSLETMGYRDFDYPKLYKWLTEKKGVKRVYLYAAIEQGDLDKAKFYEGLREIGYKVSLKKVMIYKQRPLKVVVECPECGHEHIKTVNRKSKPKANCDVEMTLDITNHGVRNKYREIIVFSGDGDFAKLYNYISNELDNGSLSVSVYSPMRKPAALRTSTAVKELAEEGTINLYPLEVIAQYYAVK